MPALPITENLQSPHLGYFWPLADGSDDPDAEPERGWIASKGQWVEVETLNENASPHDLFLDRSPDPSALAARFLDETSLLLHIRDRRPILRFGGAPRASVNRFRAHTFISRVPVDRVRSERLRAAEAHFLGVRGWWPDGPPIELQQTVDARNRSTGVSVATRETINGSGQMSGGRTLTIGTTWESSGSWDAHTLIAPVLIRSESNRALDAFEHLRPLLQVQGLLSLAHLGFVRARSGGAVVDVKPRTDDRDDPRSPLWNGSLMVPFPSVSEARSLELPLFTLGELGGPAGVARWCRLFDRHPRAFSPVVDRYHSGATSPQVGLREVAAGIEYWVNSHKPAKWAKGTKGEKLSAAFRLAEHVGLLFGHWVGDGAKWAELFWNANNDLKHDPKYEPDDQEMADLAESGRMLLASALLNQTAGSKAPSRRQFRHMSLTHLGERVREMI